MCSKHNFFNVLWLIWNEKVVFNVKRCIFFHCSPVLSQNTVQQIILFTKFISVFSLDYPNHVSLGLSRANINFVMSLFNLFDIRLVFDFIRWSKADRSISLDRFNNRIILLTSSGQCLCASSIIFIMINFDLSNYY